MITYVREYLIDLVSRTPRGGTVVCLGDDGSAVDLIAQSFHGSIVSTDVSPTGARRWMGGPIDLIAIYRLAEWARGSDPPVGEVIRDWVAHVPTGGHVCLIGWGPGEADGIPDWYPWIGPDVRAWVPVHLHGLFMSFWCVGIGADAA